MVAEESYFNRDALYEWDTMTHRRNFGQPIGRAEMIAYGNFFILISFSFFKIFILRKKGNQEM